MSNKSLILYHVTPTVNLPSILKYGLVPQIGERSHELGEEEAGGFLFSSKEGMEDALSGWLGEWFNEHYGDEYDLSILELDLPGTRVSSVSADEWEIMYSKPIPPRFIRSIFPERIYHSNASEDSFSISGGLLMNNPDANIFSINDVLHTLRECDRNEHYEGMFEHMLAFASELTGISVDGLMDCMYDLTVESWADMKRKYPMDRDEMDEETERRFVEDCFNSYEKEGFSARFWSPHPDAKDWVGQAVQVVGRCTPEGRDLCTLPMWKVHFPDGKVMDCYPEEIIPSEMRANGCPWFSDRKPGIDDQIQSASGRTDKTPEPPPRNRRHDAVPSL